MGTGNGSPPVGFPPFTVDFGVKIVFRRNSHAGWSQVLIFISSSTCLRPGSGLGTQLVFRGRQDDARLIGGIQRGEIVGDVLPRVYDYLANSSIPSSRYSGKSIFISRDVPKRGWSNTSGVPKEGWPNFSSLVDDCSTSDSFSIQCLVADSLRPTSTFSSKSDWINHLFHHLVGDISDVHIVGVGGIVSGGPQLRGWPRSMSRLLTAPLNYCVIPGSHSCIGDRLSVGRRCQCCLPGGGCLPTRGPRVSSIILLKLFCPKDATEADRGVRPIETSFMGWRLLLPISRVKESTAHSQLRFFSTFITGF